MEGVRVRGVKKSVRIERDNIFFSNLHAVKSISDFIRRSFGPKGLIKIIARKKESEITTSGARMLECLEIEHPAGKLLAEGAIRQRDEVGDGSKGVVIFASELLVKADELLSIGLKPYEIARGYEHALQVSLKLLRERAEKIETDWKTLYEIANYDSKFLLDQEFLRVVAKALWKSYRNESFDASDLDILTIQSGDSKQSFTVEGVIFKSYRKSETRDLNKKGAHILLIQGSLRLDKLVEKDREVIIENNQQYDSFFQKIDLARREVVDRILAMKIDVIVVEKEVSEGMASQLTRNGVVIVDDVGWKKLFMLSEICGAKVIPNPLLVKEEDVGLVEKVYETRIGDEKYLIIENENSSHLSVVVRGIGEDVAKMYEECVKKLAYVTEKLRNHPYFVLGGGCTEISLSQSLKKISRRETGKKQLAIEKFSEALEIIPRTLAENLGKNPLTSIVELRAAHSKGYDDWGISLEKDDVGKVRYYEPLIVKEMMLKHSVGIANMIIKNGSILEVSE